MNASCLKRIRAPSVPDAGTGTTDGKYDGERVPTSINGGVRIDAQRQRRA
jgi:hypothetical protein